MKACTHAYVNKPRNEPKRFHHVLSLTSLHGPVACEAAGASLSSCLSASSSETDRCCAASPAGDDGLGLDRLQRDLFERLLARETRDMARLGRDLVLRRRMCHSGLWASRPSSMVRVVRDKDSAGKEPAT